MRREGWAVALALATVLVASGCASQGEYRSSTTIEETRTTTTPLGPVIEGDPVPAPPPPGYTNTETTTTREERVITRDTVAE